MMKFIEVRTSRTMHSLSCPKKAQPYTDEDAENDVCDPRYFSGTALLPSNEIISIVPYSSWLSEEDRAKARQTTCFVNATPAVAASIAPMMGGWGENTFETVESYSVLVSDLT